MFSCVFPTLHIPQVLWSLVMANAFQDSYVGAIMLYPVFAFWAMLTLSVMGKWRMLI